MIRLTISCDENTWVKEVLWENYKCIHFAAGGYEATIVPDVGANLIELKDTKRNLNLLRSPNEKVDFKTFSERPQVYGIPVLFPPNRIEDGKLKVGEKEYNLPINEVKNNNYIHGFVKNDKWEIYRMEIKKEGTVEIEAVFDYNESHDFYKYFPNSFQFKLIYKLSKEGLEQIFTINNLSKEEIPVAIGYHTAFNVPFNEDCKKEDYRLIASVNKRYEQDERNLPTERIFDLSDNEKLYHTDGICPFGYKIETHYSLKEIDVRGRKLYGAIIEDTKKGLKLIYELGREYKYIVIWNDLGDKDYLCIEPQTWAINAPNLKLDKALTGFRTIAPKQSWSEVSKIFVEEK